MTTIKKYWPIIIIAIASLITHFIFFGYPQKTVFDEVHFGKFISGYFTHEYFFDIHPPLGKLMIAGMGRLGGFQPGFSFAEIGEKFPDNKYLWLRFLPTFAGALLPIIIYFLSLELGVSGSAAFASGVLLVLENAILVQSRFILLDAFLLLFGFSALLAYLIYRRRWQWVYLIAAVILATLSTSIKWTGVSFLAIISLWELWGLMHGFSLKKLAKLCAIFLLAPVIYFAIFAIHLGLLTKTGPGDAFMSTRFQKTLIGNQYASDSTIRPLGLMGKFIELNKEMYHANATLTASHPYASKWYTWPFMMRPIYYWYDGPTGGTATTPSTLSSRIYFLGNPIIWWASTVAIIYLLLDVILFEDWKKIKEIIKNRKISVLLAGSFLLNLLPFIGIKRPMFLYHYMIALVFTILTLTYLIDQTQHKKQIFTILLLVSLVVFLFFAPLSYGLPLTDHAYKLRVWFPSWE